MERGIRKFLQATSSHSLVSSGRRTSRLHQLGFQGHFCENPFGNPTFTRPIMLLWLARLCPQCQVRWLVKVLFADRAYRNLILLSLLRIRVRSWRCLANAERRWIAQWRHSTSAKVDLSLCGTRFIDSLWKQIHPNPTTHKAWHRNLDYADGLLDNHYLREIFCSRKSIFEVVSVIGICWLTNIIQYATLLRQVTIPPFFSIQICFCFSCYDWLRA